ncbi:HAMP domain-containing histidine kinase [Clostridium tagluense]|uniref:sensor histidine kinase n=1 Tax=Clostridium tagluense TaxID=360422 RepID=UPI001CF207B8|nr:HAMP domain-containing sensor histidine kinase [Clostridium tagluense]MCB2313694.1 HAMP domain-containing histidine kinase [Clostridium tagluense]MCB2318544.1 HAMP domain-containing histidine kinase [Clostridium tagluense]MCB2323356.1 HAMP domain-containing histidine kinase [Clostridium tagluense]MCB2328351.1 HAMP domain-containing histidine kinase [Clostridium tagluense]MCB2333187.1 HAMP domain-containing histidine kinase [Clostridium tagluense]
MSKNFFSTKLEIKLTLSIIISLIISISISFLVNITGEYILDNYYDKSSFLQNKSIQALSDFKSYVLKNKISIADHTKIEKWARNYKYIDIYIFKNNALVYNSNRYASYSNYENSAKIPNVSGHSYDVSFFDAEGKVYMDCYFEYKYYYITLFISTAIGLICFVIIMLTLISKKISYIRTLENEIKILEGGNLNYNITIDGNDELSFLAESINEMRKSFIERLQSENEAKSANSELITAISHDLRTPLTALLGYLDIIEYKKYKTKENLMQYIHNSREKAYQIKSLSDKLFEYFLVFNRRNDLDLETFNVNEILEQLFQEEFFMLNDENFTYDYIPCDHIAYLDMNLISIRRVFDNMFSNISKYADKSEPIKIRYSIEDQNLIITIRNKISINLKSVSSTGIGLKTCTKIIEMHNGKLSTEKTDGSFIITISLNLKLI